MLLTMVVNEEQRPICSSSNSSGGGGTRSSSKKNKQKKTPQRGMGVAQLEELRLREQQHKNGEEAASSSALPLPPPLQQQQQQQPSNIPNPSFMSTRNGINYFGNNHHHYQALPHILERSEEDRCNQDLDHRRKYNLLVSLQTDSSSSKRPQLPLRSSQQHQHQFPMANKILSASSSPGVSLQIEPPSNQSYSSSNNNYHNILSEPPSNQSYNSSSSSNYHYIPPAWPDDEKVTGVKRPWPFHPDSLTGYGGTIPCRVPVFSRESTSGSTTNHVDCRSYNNHHHHHHHGKSTADDAGFLTLGPHVVPSISRSKHPFPPSHLPDYYPTSSQVSTEDGLSQSRVSSEQPPFYSFLPLRPDSHETTSNERHGEALDGVDLNLKL